MAKLFAITASAFRRFVGDLPRDLIRRGSALALALVFMTFMLILGTGLLTVGQYMAVQSRAVGESDRYYYAAESAGQLAAQLLMREVSTKGADGTTSGILVATKASVAVSDIGSYPAPEESDVIQRLAAELVATLANIYENRVKAKIASYDPGTGSPGYFNGKPAALGVLKVSTPGSDPIEISAATDIDELFSKGIIAVSGLDSAFTPQFASGGELIDGAPVYLALGVYFANPNFVLTARSGGREVEVNTNVEFRLVIATSATHAVTAPGSTPGRFATVSDVEIKGEPGEAMLAPLADFSVAITGDTFINDREMLEDYIGSQAVFPGVPDDVRIDILETGPNVLRFYVHSENKALRAGVSKHGPLRITLPGALLESGKPLNVTRNEEAKWEIGPGTNTGGSPPEGIVPIYDPGLDNGSNLYEDYGTKAALAIKNMISDKLATAATRWSNKSWFLPAPPSGAAYQSGGSSPNPGTVFWRPNSAVTLNNGTYPDLEYIDASQGLTISGIVRCPNLKGIYTDSANMTFNIGAQLNPFEYPNGELKKQETITQVRVGGILYIRSDGYGAMPTQINWCEFYTPQIDVNYSAKGIFISNSAFYMMGNDTKNSKFDGEPDSVNTKGCMPQFYFAKNKVINVYSSEAMVGCFFMESPNSPFANENPWFNNKIHGVFVGNFERPSWGGGGPPANSYSTYSPEDWNDTIFDDQTRALLALGDPAEPSPKAYIEGETTIAGTVGVMIEYSNRIQFRVVIEDDTITGKFPKGYDYGDLVWNAPEGMEIEEPFIEGGNKSMLFEIWGIPGTPVTGPIDIVIPGFLMGKRKDIDVEIEADNGINDGLDLWAIKGTGAPSQGIWVATPSITGNLTGKGAGLHDITGSP